MKQIKLFKFISYATKVEKPEEVSWRISQFEMIGDRVAQPISGCTDFKAREVHIIGQSRLQYY